MSKSNDMKAALEKSGIPYKEIQVYGRQIVVTSWSSDAAERWADLLSMFAKVRAVLPAVDYAAKNTKLASLPSTINVYRTFAAIS